MAARIVVIEKECEHGQLGRHRYPKPPPGGWLPGDLDLSRVCPGGSRRVLDPNSFLDEVAHTVMAWTWTIDAVPDMESPIEGLDLANRILDALAGGEQP